MKYVIWYNPQSSHYDHGTEADFNVHKSLTGLDLTVLYELDHTEVRLVKKIATQLNTARQEQSVKYEYQGR